MKATKWCLLTVLTLILVFTTGKAEAANPKDMLVVGVASDPSTLDPGGHH